MPRHLILGSLAAVALLFSVGCPTSKPACSDTCQTGCCSADGTCEGGGAATACGTQGNACVACGAGQDCIAQQCVPRPTGDGGMVSDAGSGGDGGTRSVVVTRVVSWHRETASMDVPEDLRDAGLAVYLPRADGGFEILKGTGTAAGTWTANNVPAGTYYLRYRNAFYVSSESQLDLGYDNAGRPSPQQVNDAGTLVTVNATGLMPWQDSDGLDVSSVDNGYLFWGSDVGALPDAGSTSHTFQFDYLAAYQYIQGPVPAPLIDAAAGDRTYLTQLSTRSLALPDGGTDWYRSVSRSLALTTFTVTPGQNNTINASFTTPAQQAVNLTWKRSAFVALKPDVHPLAVSESQLIDLHAMPYTSAYGFYSSDPDLAVYRPGDGYEPGNPDFTGDSDLSLSLAYRNPFPSSWPQVGSVTQSFRVRYPQPDAGVLTGPILTVTHDDVLASFEAAPLTPKLSPPRTLRINGQDGTLDQVLAGPLAVSWTAPAVGTPSSYSLTLWKLSRGAGTATQRTRIATVRTQGTSAVLPAELVTPGSFYVVVLGASANAGERASAPLRRAFPESWAPTTSGLLSTP